MKNILKMTKKPHFMSIFPIIPIIPKVPKIPPGNPGWIAKRGFLSKGIILTNPGWQIKVHQRVSTG